MTATRRAIDELVARFGLDDRAADRLEALHRLIATDPTAPTTVRDELGVLEDHLADSLVALDVAELRQATRVADLGSGAGFPGLPLAIALPDTAFFLVESNRRKCRFIESAIAASGAGNATAVNARAEAWLDGLGTLDVVTARALAPLAVVAEYAAPVLRLGGVLIAWRGRRDSEAERAAARAAQELGLEVRDPLPVWPYAGAEHRHLHVMAKVRETPERFPRRPGTAAKRPLGAGSPQRPTDADPASDRKRR